jgi:hypothetical protein
VLKLSESVYGLFIGLLIANSWAAAFDVVDERNYSFAAAFMTLTSGIAAGTGVWLAGIWKESFVSLMGWSALIGAVSALVLIWVTLTRFDTDIYRLTRAERPLSP